MATTTDTSEITATGTVFASFHLVRYPSGKPARTAFSRMGLDRPQLAATPGLRFWQLLGTAKGEQMSLSADWRRWALLAFWRSEADHDAFLATSDIPKRWDDLASERFDLRVAVARAHGTWARASFNIDRAAPLHADAPVAILTRAAIRPTRARAFWPAVAKPALDLSSHPAHLASVGIGELPVIRQATFSLWSSLAGAQDFAYRRAAHRDVIARTRKEGWYSSELFARMQPLGTSGTWDGRDPLEGLIG